MADFKEKAIEEITNTLPDNYVYGVEGNCKINITENHDAGSVYKKCCITITWEELIKHPCSGCHYCNNSDNNRTDTK